MLCLASFLPLGVPAPTFPRRAGGGTRGRPGGQEHPSRLLLGAAARSPSGKEGKEKCELPAVAALVTRQDARPGQALNEEEGGRGGELGGRTLRGVRREEFEARIWTVSPGCAGVEWRGWLLPPSAPAGALCPAARYGDAVAPCPRGRARQEAAPGGATEGPRGARWVSQMPSPAPTAKLASEGGGRAGGGATQSFQRHFQGVGSKLFCRARTEGRSDSARVRVEPALDTQPSAWERQETGPEADRLGLR